MFGYIACVFVGAVGMLLLQAAWGSFLDWWYDVLDVARSWAVTILCVAGVVGIFYVLVQAAN